MAFNGAKLCVAFSAAVSRKQGSGFLSGRTHGKSTAWAERDLVHNGSGVVMMMCDVESRVIQARNITGEECWNGSKAAPQIVLPMQSAR